MRLSRNSLAVDIKYHYWVNNFPLLPHFSESLFCELSPSGVIAPCDGRLTSFSEARSWALLICEECDRPVRRLSEQSGTVTVQYTDNTGILLEQGKAQN